VLVLSLVLWECVFKGLIYLRILQCQTQFDFDQVICFGHRGSGSIGIQAPKTYQISSSFRSALQENDFSELQQTTKSAFFLILF